MRSHPVEPTKEDGDCARVEPEPMTASGDDPKIGAPMGICDDPGIEHGDDAIFGTVHDQQGPVSQA